MIKIHQDVLEEARVLAGSVSTCLQVPPSNGEDMSSL